MQKIIPAILTADPEELRDALTVLRGHCKWVHIDIADGKFVPNKTIGLFQLKEAYQFFDLEIHLMVDEPEKYFMDCQDVGAKRAIFHYEAVKDFSRFLEEGRKYDFQKGVALNPDTPADAVRDILGDISSVLVMGVHPGFQGQPFVPGVLDKAAELRALPNCPLLGIDGAMGEETIPEAFRKGVDYAVVGSRIIKAEDPVDALRRFEEMV